MIRIVRSIARRLPSPVQNWARQIVETRRISRYPDRAVLLEQVLPALRQTRALANDAKVLWIGCRPYTTLYYDLIEQSGA